MIGLEGQGIISKVAVIGLFSDSRAGEGSPQKLDHAVIGGVVAVVMFAILCALIVLGRYFARHKGIVRFHTWPPMYSKAIELIPNVQKDFRPGHQCTVRL